MLPSMFCASMQYDKWKMHLVGSVPFKLLQGKSGKYKYAFNIFQTVVGNMPFANCDLRERGSMLCVSMLEHVVCRRMICV